MALWDVLVVGAGMSGLGAACVLYKEGVKVCVLEARDRPGGRVHSITLPSIAVENEAEASPTYLPPIDVDLGANYLIGCSNSQIDQPLFHLAKMNGVESVVCAGDLHKKYRGWECAEVAIWRDHRTGELIDHKEVGEMVFLTDKVLHRALWLVQSANYAAKQQDQTPCFKVLIETALKHILNLELEHGLRPNRNLTERERGIFDSLMARYIGYVNPLERVPLDMLNEMFAGIATGFTQQMNVFYHTESVRKIYFANMAFKLQDLASQQPHVASKISVTREDRLITGRFGKIVDALVEQIPDQVLYGMVVERIDWSCEGEGEGEVRLTARSEATGAKMSFRCRHCLVTLPVGVLKGLDSRSSVEFEPVLPEAKRAAIDRLGIPEAGAPTHNKVIIRYRPDQVFWDADAPHLECPDIRLHILNLHTYGKTGVLLAHLWGSSGLVPTGVSDEVVVKQVTDLLAGMYPAAAPLPVPLQTVVTRWSEDPFSLGAYTAGEPGSDDAVRKEYAGSLPSEENPKLLFAGEGTLTSEQAKECTHGALMSGINRAVTLLGKVKPGVRIPMWKIASYLMGKVGSVNEQARVRRIKPAKPAESSEETSFMRKRRARRRARASSTNKKRSRCQTNGHHEEDGEEEEEDEVEDELNNSVSLDSSWDGSNRSTTSSSSLSRSSSMTFNSGSATNEESRPNRVLVQRPEPAALPSSLPRKQKPKSKPKRKQATRKQNSSGYRTPNRAKGRVCTDTVIDLTDELDGSEGEGIGDCSFTSPSEISCPASACGDMAPASLDG